jgi:SAM-dependent methyltransferase
MTPGERWLATIWPLVRAHLPPSPARVVDVGCGTLGGFVPILRAEGYDAVGIDPEAPDEPHYRQVEFESAVLPEPVDAAVASVSLHHVVDPARVIDRLVNSLASGGAVVVIEWASEDFDEQTAQWCFERLSRNDEGWLGQCRNDWLASGNEWASYLRGWTEREALHAGRKLVRLLDERLERRHLGRGPYFFADLPETTEVDEQAAIDTGEIRPNRIDYVGVRP